MLQGDLRPSRRSFVLVALVLALAAAGGCGGGSTGNGTTAPTASAPEATAPPTDATQPGTGATTTPAGTTPAQTETLPSYRGQRGNSGGGGRHVRVPATFTVVGTHLEPRTITVPPFLAIQLTLRTSDRQFHRLKVLMPEGRELDIGPEQRQVSLLIPGQRAGRYKVRLDFEPSPVATLVVGGEVGP